MDTDLQGRLLSLRNMIDLALLAFQLDRCDLLPTALEEIAYKAQMLLQSYCIVDNYCAEKGDQDESKSSQKN